jgi:hypothetical protein
MIFYTEQLVTKAKKAANSGINRDSPEEGGAELRGTLGEHSFASLKSN